MMRVAGESGVCVRTCTGWMRNERVWSSVSGVMLRVPVPCTCCSVVHPNHRAPVAICYTGGTCCTQHRSNTRERHIQQPLRTTLLSSPLATHYTSSLLMLAVYVNAVITQPSRTSRSTTADTHSLTHALSSPRSHCHRTRRSPPLLLQLTRSAIPVRRCTASLH